MRNLASSEFHNDSEKNKTAKIDKYIKVKLGDLISFPSKPKTPNSISYHNEVDPDPLHIPDIIPLMIMVFLFMRNQSQITG